MKTMQAAQGKWKGILSHFGVDERFLQNRHGPCPVCDGKDRYRFDDKDGNGTYYCNACGAGTGMDLLMKIKGWDFSEAAKEVDKIIHNVQPVEQPKKKDPRIRLRKIQEELLPVTGINPVSLYLKSRNLPHSEQLMYHPGLPYYDSGRFVGKFPAMVAKVLSPAGNPLTYHVTHLTAQGDKAPVSSVKKILTPVANINGSAVRLASYYKVLGVAEGIETALAVMRDYKVPTWALLNANNMESFIPPDDSARIIIFADNDESFTGQKSAYALANKLALKGYEVEVRVPEWAGTDFADQGAA